jgi:hypothetical protein
MASAYFTEMNRIFERLNRNEQSGLVPTGSPTRVVASDALPEQGLQSQRKLQDHDGLARLVAKVLFT